MLNIGRPKKSRRRLLSKVIKSLFVYGALIWKKARNGNFLTWYFFYIRHLHTKSMLRASFGIERWCPRDRGLTPTKPLSQ